ncbi:MAG: hypothetical protein JKY56_10260, partial [Kofleriaceae bacterium]|nr:hypothetical protein [Kofleriaceae bacterium]
MKRPSLCVALLAISVAMPVTPAMADEPGAEEIAKSKENSAQVENKKKSQEEKIEKLTTEVWVAQSPPLDLHWHVLALPEYAVEMFFAPLGLFITIVERYRVDRRVYSLLRNDAGTVVVGPKFKISGSDGIGIGAGLSLNRIFEKNFYVKMSGLYRLNGDYELGVKYQRNIPWLEGRSLEFRMDYESNANLPYYGIGEDSTSDKQVLQEDFFDSYLSL